MSLELQELAQHIRQTLPQSKQMINLQVLQDAGLVTFGWQGREFVVRTSREVFEVRGKNLYVTGSSMLIQTVLMKTDTNEKTVAGLVDVIAQAEEMINGRRQVDHGLRLLSQAKGTLARLAGKAC